MGLADKAKEKLERAAGGVRATREGPGEGDEARQPNEARFEPEEVRRRSKPGDNLPKPEASTEP